MNFLKAFLKSNWLLVAQLIMMGVVVGLLDGIIAALMALLIKMGLPGLSK